MTRVIHTGDTHIGYRQYHSPDRRDDFLAAFEAVVSDAIDMEVDAVLHAGDLFHDTRPDLDDLMGTIRILRELAAAEIPFLGIVGNHERTRDRQWMDLLVDLGLATRLDATGTRIGDVTFYGLDWIPPSQRERLAYQFEPPETEASALVAHGLFEPFAHADWETETLLSRANVDFDALLLGDNHTPDRAQVEGTWVTYCGSTERASASEREERGYNVVTFADEEVRIARRTLDETRSFAYIDIELAPGEGAERVRARVEERDVEDTVVIVHIEGAGEEVHPATVEQTAMDAGALVVRVMDAREREADDRPTVRFADPDRAVEEHVQELGLSSAGHMVDAIVRDETVPDTRVRDRVRARIETLLAEAPEAFEAKEPAEPASDPEPTPAEQTSDGESGQTSIGEF